MSDTINKRRLNRKSYALNMLISLPAYLIAIVYGREVENTDLNSEDLFITMGYFAMIFALIMTIPVVLWTIQRLHDLNGRGWFAFLLLPPFATLFIIFMMLAPGSKGANRWGEDSSSLRIFGIRAKGWRILPIMLITIFLLYLAGLFGTFYADPGIS